MKTLRLIAIATAFVIGGSALVVAQDRDHDGDRDWKRDRKEQKEREKERREREKWQRQRISIARAFLKDAPILILDEPTSALDAKTESGVLEAMERLMAGRTTFVIAHRLNTIRSCDLLLVLEQGRLKSVQPREQHVDSQDRGTALGSNAGTLTWEPLLAQ